MTSRHDETPTMSTEPILCEVRGGVCREYVKVGITRTGR